MKKTALLILSLFLQMPLWAQIYEEDETLYSEEDTTVVADSVPADLSWPMNVQARLDRLMKSTLLETTQLGLMVWDLTDDLPIYQHNHQQLMRPASTMKLVTAITALQQLQGNYKLYTSLYMKGRHEGRTFTGNIYVKGGMDPAFDISDLRDFVYQLQHGVGVDTLRGCIVADVSMKDTLKWGEGWCWDDKNPILSPLLIGKKANFVERFANELARNGVVLDNVMQSTGYVPSDAYNVATCERSIDEVLLRMLKESDNLYAEALYYQLAASYGSQPARAIHARTLEKQLVNHLGLYADDYRFADGSGLSLYNYVSPELEVALLRHAWLEPAIYAHLLPALPIAGEDGTLKKRMLKTPAQGNVRAKTGTLTGIISLAGYCTAANGHQLCFCIINQGALHATEARRFQDRVCVALCQ